MSLICILFCFIIYLFAYFRSQKQRKKRTNASVSATSNSIKCQVCDETCDGVTQLASEHNVHIPLSDTASVDISCTECRGILEQEEYIEEEHLATQVVSYIKPKQMNTFANSSDASCFLLVQKKCASNSSNMCSHS